MPVSNPLRPILLRTAFTILFALLLSSCAERGIQLPESQFLRALESKSGLIAYLGMDGNLYTIDQSGSEQQQITDDVAGLPLELAFNYRLFSWSPDGNRLAYTGFSPEEWTLRISGPAGEGDARLFGADSATPLFLQWISEGMGIAFLTLSDPMETGGVSRISLHAVAADGEQDARLLAEGESVFFDWEPGGTRVLTHIDGASADNPTARITLVGEDGMDPHDLPMIPAHFQSPAWSPDGSQLLSAISMPDGRNALVAADPQGETLQTITTFENSIAFSWSPDGKHVAYILSDRSRHGVTGPLTVVNLDEPEGAFTTEENLVHAFFWSPDSKEIVYFTQELVSDGGEDNLFYGLGVHFLNVNKEEVRHLQAGQNHFVFQPTPQFRHYLLGFDQYQHSGTIWSPDSEYIVLPALTGSQGVILVVPVSGNLAPRPIVDGLMALWSWE